MMTVKMRLSHTMATVGREGMTFLRRTPIVTPSNITQRVSSLKHTSSQLGIKIEDQLFGSNEDKIHSP